jgi:uncharacterized damage-inducible protein DinB
MAGIELLELNDWLDRQLAAWDAWAAERTDEAWLALPTGNERFPTVGELYRHCFSPLLRYSAQAAENPPPDDSHIDPRSWAALHGWAVEALGNHRTVCSSVTRENADAVLPFTTRSAGVLSVTRRMALAHAATHCFWHLGGIAHLLRLSGIAPPQRSDLLFYAIAQAEAAP